MAGGDLPWKLNCWRSSFGDWDIGSLGILDALVSAFSVKAFLKELNFTGSIILLSKEVDQLCSDLVLSLVLVLAEEVK